MTSFNDSIPSILSIKSNGNGDTPIRSKFTALLIELILNDSDDIRNTAITIAYNVSLWNGTSDEDAEVRSEWCAEILVAVINALEKMIEKKEEVDSNDEVVERCVNIIGNLIWKAPDSLIQLSDALGLVGLLGKIDSDTASIVIKLCK
jgi:hypothetical protein